MDHASGLVFRRPQAASHRRSVAYFCSAVLTLVGRTLFFDGTASTAPPGRSINTYAWDFGDGDTASGPSPTHVYATENTFVVVLTVTDSHGVSATATQGIAVGGLDPVASFTVSPESGTTDTTFSFDASASTAVPQATIEGYAWDFGDGNLAAGLQPTVIHMFTTAGTYTVTLVVSDSLGGAGVTTQDVDVADP